MHTDASANSAKTCTIACASSLKSRREKAAMLAQQLRLPLVSGCNSPHRYQLVYTDARLEFRGPPPEGGRKRWRLFVDFVGGKGGHRRMFNATIRQPLARAAGIQPGIRPAIVDATAGLGGDGFVFASLGCKVILVERSPIIAALLQDGINRAGEHEATAEIAQRLRLVVGDAKEELQRLSPRPQTVYLDPMYPPQGKTALNKKEMRMLRSLAGDDADAEQLFLMAIEHAERRVVVKRPRGAETLSRLLPAHQIRMKSSRFDVYMSSP